MKENLDRRTFLKSGAAGAGTACLLSVTGCNQENGTMSLKKASLCDYIAAGDTVVFQGDSVTDGARYKGVEDRVNDQGSLGPSYSFIVSSTLLAQRPCDDLKFYNRGISGNKVYQLSDRWDKDCINLKPNVLSILIGINDIWHTKSDIEHRSNTPEKFEKGYIELIEKTKSKLPDVKLVIGEPFAIRGGVFKDAWIPDFLKYQAVVRKIAKKYNAVFVPYQSEFDNALKIAPLKAWSPDGVHPSPAGCKLMADAWMKAVTKQNRL